MTVNEMEDLWDLAGVIHRARVTLAWGQAGATREPWPKFSTAYSHNPIAYVDMALASAKAVVNNFKIDVALAAGPAAAN
jgi:hypothetical protein